MHYASELPAAYRVERAHPHDIPEVIALADRVFRPDGRSSMGSEFPLFLSPENAHNIYIARSQHRIVSMLGVCHRSLILPHAVLPTAMIGAVATDEEHRGHGLAGALLDAALADAHAAGVAVVVISGGRGLYQRRGAREAGALMKCSVPAPVWQQWHNGSDVVWRPYEPADVFVLHTLHAQQVPRFERTPITMDAAVRARPCGVTTVTAVRGGRPVAYAVFKSVGETALVTEFNGDLSCVFSLPAWLPSTFKGALEFLLYARHPLVAVLQQKCQAVRVPAPFDGTLVWGNFTACVAALANYWQACGIPALHAKETAAELLLTDGTHTVRLSPPAMCAAVWGAPDAPALPPAWQSAFPLPLCPYGLDFI